MTILEVRGHSPQIPASCFFSPDRYGGWRGCHGRNVLYLVQCRGPW